MPAEIRQPTPASLFPLDLDSVRRGALLNTRLSESAVVAAIDGDLEALPDNDPYRYLLELRARPGLATLERRQPDDTQVAAYRAGVRVGAGIMAYREQRLSGEDAPFEHPVFVSDNGPVYERPRPVGWQRPIRRWVEAYFRGQDGSERALQFVDQVLAAQLMGVMKTTWTERGYSFMPEDVTNKPNGYIDAAISNGVCDVLELFADLHGTPRITGVQYPWKYDERKHIRRDEQSSEPRYDRQQRMLWGLSIEALSQELDDEETTHIADTMQEVHRNSGYRAYIPMVLTKELPLPPHTLNIHSHPQLQVWWNTEVPVGATVTDVHYYDSHFVFLNPGSTSVLAEVANKKEVQRRTLGRRDALVALNTDGHLLKMAYPFRVTEEMAGGSSVYDKRVVEILRLCRNGEAIDMQGLDGLTDEQLKTINEFTDGVLAEQALQRQNSRVGNFLLNKVVPRRERLESLSPILAVLASSIALSGSQHDMDTFVMSTMTAGYAAYCLPSVLRSASRRLRQRRDQPLALGPVVPDLAPGQASDSEPF